MAEARAGRFDLLLVYRVDRLACSVGGLAQILEDLDRAGVAFRTATEPFDTATPAGRMMVRMLAVFAEFERATIIDRVIVGMERKAARGEWCGGSRPFGYRVDPASGTLKVAEGEAPLVPVIFDRYARQGLGSQALARWLNEHGHRTKTGRPWSHPAVLTVLRNRAYIGEVFFRSAHYPARHTPLIDAELFDAAQRLLSTRSQDMAERATNQSDYLLSGLIVCLACGKRFVGTNATGNRYTYRYCTCRSRQRQGTRFCAADRLPADELDAAVLHALLALYESTDLVHNAVADACAEATADRARLTAEQALVEAEMRTIEQAIDRYLLAFEAGALPEAQCGARVRGLGAQLAELRDRQADLTAALEDFDIPPPSAQTLASLQTELQRAVDAGPTRQRRELVRALVHEIRVEGRDAIHPLFRILRESAGHPKARRQDGRVGPAGIEPATNHL